MGCSIHDASVYLWKIVHLIPSVLPDKNRSTVKWSTAAPPPSVDCRWQWLRLAEFSFGAEMDWRTTFSLLVALLATLPLSKSTAIEPELKSFTLQDLLLIKDELGKELFERLYDILIAGEALHQNIIEALSDPRAWFLENEVLGSSEESIASENQMRIVKTQNIEH